MNQLDALKQWTKVVADTGDWTEMQRFQPDEATTNPTLILKLFQKEEHEAYLRAAVEQFKEQPSSVEAFLERVLVSVGKKILEIIPGRVSTEVDARYSFDQEATLNQARRLMALYQHLGIPRQRVLIKIAATWEGIRAAEILEKEGISCNLTLIFSLVQAKACAEAGVTLISPFVGRILDWYKARTDWTPGSEDPGVLSVTAIYHELKRYGFKTEIMGASFRNIEEILCLAGCDRLTISPNLLAQLVQSEGDVELKLKPPNFTLPYAQAPLSESEFRWQLNEDPMATEKLSEGIRSFAADTLKLKTLLQEFLKRQN